MSGFDALHRYHFSPDFQSNQQLSKITDKVNRLILANSLAYSQGPRTVDHGPRLLEPFVSGVCISVRGWGPDKVGKCCGPRISWRCDHALELEATSQALPPTKLRLQLKPFFTVHYCWWDFPWNVLQHW